jgi:hypothetical protein
MSTVHLSAPQWPQHPSKRTKSGRPGDSEMGQERTHAPQQTAPLFDLHTGDVARRSPFPRILGRDRLP